MLDLTISVTLHKRYNDISYTKSLLLSLLSCHRLNFNLSM